MARIALFEHVKLKRLCRQLKIGRPLAVGLLEMLTYYVGQHAVDGDLSNMTDADIELAVEWDGEAGTLVAAMLACRLLDRAGGQTVIHDWADWAPEWIRGRLRAKKSYEEKRREEKGSVALGARDSTDSAQNAQKSADLRRQPQGPSIPTPEVCPERKPGSAAAPGVGIDGLPKTRWRHGAAGEPQTGPTRPHETPPPGLSAAQLQADLDARVDGDLKNAVPFHVEHAKGPTEPGYPPQRPMQQHPVDETDRDAGADGRHGLPVDVYDALIAGWGNSGGRALPRAWGKVRQLVDECNGDTALALTAIAQLRAAKGRAVDILTVAASIQKVKSETVAREGTRHARVIFGDGK